MIPPHKIAEVEALLTDNGWYSLRAIAEITGVSRGTIEKIKAGKRELKTTRSSSGDPFQQVAPYRCPGCGQRVYLRPCVICASTAIAKIRRLGIAAAFASALAICFLRPAAGGGCGATSAARRIHDRRPDPALPPARSTTTAAKPKSIQRPPRPTLQTRLDHPLPHEAHP